MTRTIAIIAVAGATGLAGAQIATQNFDDNSTGARFTDNSSLVGGQFTDPGRTFDGTGLGWTLRWDDTRGTGSGGPVDGGESGDFIGVTDFTGDVGSFTSGTQGFQFDDGDGALTLSFDSIDATGVSGLGLTFDLWVGDTTYESDDLFQVAVNGQPLLTLGEPELEAFPTGFTPLSIDLSGFDGQSSVQIDFVVDTNSGSETLYLDTVAVTPAPAGASLLAMGGLAGVRRRRA